MIDKCFGEDVLEDVIEVEESPERRARADSPTSPMSRSGTEKTVKMSSSMRNIHQQVQTELYFIRFLQAILFLVSYVFARTLMDFHEWEDYLTKTLLSCCLFLILFFVLVVTLKYLVPTFLALWSLPPYVDEGNLTHFFAILLDDHAISCTEEGDIVATPSSRSNGGHGRHSPLTKKVENLCEEMERIRQHTPGADADFDVHERYTERETSAIWAAIKKLEERLDGVCVSTASERPMQGNGIERATL